VTAARAPLGARLRERAPLAPRTTLGVGGSARFAVEALDEADVVEALSLARERGVPLVVLGGGSNVLVADEGLDAIVLRPALRGIESRDEGDHVIVTAMAGEPWDGLVDAAVTRGLSGIECLAGIPGDIGATPIQNVGAYGQEVAQTIRRVRVVERDTGAVRELSAAECAFGYRDSVFKRQAKDRFVVVAVEFALSPGAPEPPRYSELATALGARAADSATIARTVRELRRKKSMLLDPSDENARSAGSFFTNPTIDTAALAALEERVAPVLAAGEAMPRWPGDGGRVKLSAAWLIERAGFAKGTRDGLVGLSTRHTLAIVTRAGARAADVLAFARRVRDGVLERFGVRLVPEPVFLGFEPEAIADLVASG
jgi:UDP-N-acetylmuramate dehydrogenase